MIRLSKKEIIPMIVSCMPANITTHNEMLIPTMLNDLCKKGAMYITNGV